MRHATKLFTTMVLAAAGLAAAPALAMATDEIRVVTLKGTSKGEVRTIRGTEYTCYDVDLIDTQTGVVIGTATDCLDFAGVTPIGDDGGFAITNLSIFNFFDGTVVSLSRTSIQPVETASRRTTHITGEVALGNNIQRKMGTGHFAGKKGNTRLSGMVNLSKADRISFDCIFVITITS